LQGPKQFLRRRQLLTNPQRLTAFSDGVIAVIITIMVLALRKFDRGDRPLSIVAPDREPKAMQFVKPNLLHRPGRSVGENHGFADKFGLGFLQRAEDRGRTGLRRWHG
jgi:Endosomal/lysosomal potassium channel TMEM175